MTWAGRVERLGDEKLAKRARHPESGGKKETRKNENSDLERVRDEYRTTVGDW